ncbi:LPD38 domain-containing protein [Anaerovorax sp. IOR16]|uniref:LPD38 domain-containing protein n=1 Tax=Anaerovorax sp. IOR16 TaxID=2773458 RepID=UPI0019D1828A|nr:LPD38 domain-containing protein [Anaerovorax sp. IOR16]
MAKNLLDEMKKKRAAELRAQNAWIIANKKGDKAGMARAHAEADRARGFSTKSVKAGSHYVQAPTGKALEPLPLAFKQPEKKKTITKSKKKTPPPKKKQITVPKSNPLNDVFDKKETYVDKAKKGNYLGAGLNFVGTGVQAGQSLYLNGINAVDALAHGKKPKFQYNMDKSDYDKAVVKRRGKIETITDKLMKKNEFLGSTYNLLNEMSTDPIDFTPLGLAGDIKLARGLGEGSETYMKALKRGTLSGDLRTVKEGVEKIPVVQPDGKVKYKTIRKNSFESDIRKPISTTKEEKSEKLLLPEQSNLLRDRGYPTNDSNLKHKTIYIEQDRINDLAKSIESITNADTRKKVKSKLKELFGGKSYVVNGVKVKGIPYKMDISSKGIGEIASKQEITPELISVIEKLDEVVQNAHYFASEPDKRLREDVLRSDLFRTNISLGDNVATATTRSNALKDGTNKLYFTGLDKNRTANPQPRADSSLQRGIVENDSINLKVPQHFLNVNAKLPKFFDKKMPKNQQFATNITEKSNPLKKFYTNIVDNQFALTDSTRGIEQTADKDIKILGSNARNVRGSAEYAFRKNLVDMQGKKIGENSLESILGTTKGEEDALKDYLLHKHNIARYRQEKPIFIGDGMSPTITDEMSRQIVKEYEKLYPHFADKSKQLNEFNGKFIDNWLVKSGLINEDFANLLKTMYPDYVPTLRETGGVAGKRYSPKGLKANSGIKGATGGNDPIMAINRSYPIMIQKAMKAARQNEIYNGLLDAVTKEPVKMSKWAKLADDNSGKMLDASLLENAKTAINENGIDGIETLANKQLQIDERMGKYYVTAMKNGKPIRMQVHKDLFDALNSLNRTGNEGVLDSLANAVGKYASNPFKALITGYNPFFALRNIARDVPTAYIQGTENNPIKWAGNLIEAGKHMAKNDETYQEFLALGGKMNGFFNSERGLVPDRLPTRILRKTGETISTFNEATETLPRFGEYLGTVKREGGDYAAKQKGIYNQGEVTVNFGRHGDITKSIDRVTPYLNPSVQGIDKSIRSLRKPSTWAKGLGVITVPTAAMYAINNRTPEDKSNYEQLDNRTKDNYFLFPTGEGKYIKIPKSRESGVIFSTLAERLYGAAQGQKEPFKGFGNTVATNFSPSNPIENNILSPFVYYMPRNKDFANRAIVPTSMTNEGYGDARSKYLQYDDATSEIGKWLGDEMRKIGVNNGEGLSPKQIDYIIDSYTGIIGDLLLPATTKGDSPVNKVLTRPFTADVLYNNNIQTDFYDKFEDAKRIKSDNNLINDIPKEWITPEEKRLSVYTKASLEMSELRKQEKQIMANMPDGVKKELQLREIRKQILNIAESTTTAAEKAYEEYKKTYIPEISYMSDRQKANYKKYAEPAGLKPDIYAKTVSGANRIESDKDENGESLKNVSKKRKAYIDKMNPTATREQLQILYEAAGVSKTVGHYRKQFK